VLVTFGAGLVVVVGAVWTVVTFLAVAEAGGECVGCFSTEGSPKPLFVPAEAVAPPSAFTALVPLCLVSWRSRGRCPEVVV
jgi:hypothetical protein